MRFTKFRIKNFKGISSAEIDLAHFGQGKVFTLVGLNECGKTTILEAINSFSPDLTAEPIFQNDVFRKIEYKDLVPKHRKDNFTGNVEVEAFLELSDDDRLVTTNKILPSSSNKISSLRSTWRGWETILACRKFSSSSNQITKIKRASGLSPCMQKRDGRKNLKSYRATLGKRL